MHHIAGLEVGSEAILNALSDGVYVTDADRRIVYWNEAAERITGYSADQVVGKYCRDNVLCHVDKDGRSLCGKEHCPMHRSIVTGKRGEVPTTVFALNCEKDRVPMQVTVAPIRDESGTIIGAVESFRDMSQVLDDLQRAKRIQRHALERGLPNDERLRFSVHYAPNGVVGGDFYAVEKLDDSRFSVLIADVMGHGIGSALHTMFLRTIWQEYRAELVTPGRFLETLNAKLHPLVEDDSAFATAVLFLLDLDDRSMVYAGAGHTSPFLFRAGGGCERLDGSGLPAGMMSTAEYQESRVELETGDCVLAYTDAAVEVEDESGRELGEDGLLGLLRANGYPGRRASLPRIETALLRYSNALCLADDLTMLEFRIDG